MPIRGVHIVFSYQVAVGRTISEKRLVLDMQEIEGHQEIEFALNRRGLPLDFLGFYLIAWRSSSP